MAKTVKVAQTSDLSPGTGKVVQADGRSIALFNVEGTFYAIDNTCTHKGGPSLHSTRDAVAGCSCNCASKRVPIQYKRRH